MRGNDAGDRIAVGREIYDRLQEKQVFPRLSSEPDLNPTEEIRLVPNAEQWSLLGAKTQLTPLDVADISRTATLGRRLWQMPIAGQIVPIQLAYTSGRISSSLDLASLPIGVGGKLVPLKALAHVERTQALPNIYRENGNDKIIISGRVNKGDEATILPSLNQARAMIDAWNAQNQSQHSSIVTFEDANRELNEALRQLSAAVAISVALIFLTMIFQFGDVMNALLVLVAVPLGFVGVLLSLFVCQSTLSLNSVLGVILLNGIAVANSIILVDFLTRLVNQGLEPRTAAREAASKRLRPILMTSMTTGLGMLPVALGFGEGGRILQPLGIAVIGGLSFSMMTTLFIVPSLQVSYLLWRFKERGRTVPLPGDRETAAWVNHDATL